MTSRPMDAADPQPHARQDVSPAFARVEDEEIGYEPTHVDAFMDRARLARAGEAELTAEQVRQARFATVGGGYATDQVDDELDRLEEELTRSERDAWVAEHGDETWGAHITESTRELLDRADRAPAERFRRPSREGAESYAVDDVDAFVDRLRGALAGEDAADAVSADDVRRVSFAAASGRAGYDEAQVDAYLDAAVDVLLRRS